MKQKTLLLIAILELSICSIGLFATESKDSTSLLTENNLNEINIVGNHRNIYSENLRVITSITKEQIKNLPVQNVNELLDYLPGIDVRQRGTNGVQADVSMRGGTFDQVLILLNGINITDPQTGHYNMDLPVDLSMIERIELLQGTSMTLFGLSAFSGAINIITNESAKNTIKASLSGGDFGFLNPAAEANYHTQKWDWAGSVSHNESSGYMENTDYQFSNVFFQSGFSGKKTGKFDFQLGGQAKEFGSNSFYSLAYPDQFEKTKTLLSSLQWDKQIRQFNLTASCYYRAHFDQFELFRDYKNAASWYTNHNYHLSEVLAGNLKASYFSSFGKTSVGVEIRNEHIYSNVLGELMEEPKKIPFENTNALFLYEKNRTNFNYFGEQSLLWKKLSLSLGLSGNYNSMFGNNICFGLNTGYEFAPNSSIYANVNKAIRLPTFTDLYYKSATQESNPNLKSEESLTSEIGVKWQKDNLCFNGSGFYRIGKNIIDWVRTTETEKWKSMNHTRIDGVGSELSASYHYGYYLKKIQLSYSFVLLDKESDDFISKYALDYLKNKFVVSLEHGIYKNFGANWQTAYQQRMGSFVNVSGQKTAYNPFWTVDGQIYWSNEKLKIFLEATNILNQDYYDYGGIQQPGRFAKLGISVCLGY